MQALSQRIVEIKAEHGLSAWHPVKWNIRDLRKAYEATGDGMLYERLMRESDAIRSEMLSLISEFDTIAMACGLQRFSGTPSNADCYSWAFENLMQRVGLLARERRGMGDGYPTMMIIADWPQKGVDKTLFDVYAAGYHHGKALDSFSR